MFHDIIMILLFLHAREHLYVIRELLQARYTVHLFYLLFSCLHAREHAKTMYRGILMDVSREND